MHYKNGRPAKQGDRVIDTSSGASGIVHHLQANAETCNARLAPSSDGDRYVTLRDCLHLDDITAATVPDSSKPAQ